MEMIRKPVPLPPVTGMHGLVDSATFVRQGQVLLSVDARFLSTEWAGGFVGCMAGFMA